MSATICGKIRATTDSSEMMRTVPLTAPLRLAISARARWNSFCVSRTWRNKSSPAAVGRTPDRPRSKSGTPISFSRRRIWRLTAEEAMLSASAALRIEPWRAT